MNKLIITRGLQGSGKSFKAKAWVDEDPGQRSRVNRDCLRVMLHGRWLGAPEQERQVTEIQRPAVRQLLLDGRDVVVDDTNLPSEPARQWATLAKEVGVGFEVWDLSWVPLQVCLERDAVRTGNERVGEDVIRRMYGKYIAPLKGKPFPPVVPFTAPSERATPAVSLYVQPSPGEAPDVVLVDLDGTMALMGDRSPYNWGAVGDDAVNEPVRTVVLALLKSGIAPVFMSGRDAVCRPQTTRWLDRHVPEAAGSPLFMRPEGDQRPDTEVKRDLFDRFVRRRYRVVAVLDDRDPVVRMWRAMGLTVLQVAEGNF